MRKQPEEIFRSCGGQLRMSEAIKRGITRYMLYSLRDKGVIEQVSRGVYRLVELPPISNPDLVTVSLRFPKAVICLISALAYHDITTQVRIMFPWQSPGTHDCHRLIIHQFGHTGSLNKRTDPVLRSTKSTGCASRSTALRKP